MRRILLLLTSTAVAGLFACSDGDGVTDPASHGAPAFGATVTRFDGVFPQLFIDPVQGITVLPGVGIDELSDLCAGGDFTDVARWLDVSHPAPLGGTVDHIRIRDQARSVIVWAAVPQQSICEDLGDLPPLAVGTVQMTFTDNNFFGAGSHNDSFGERVEGIVSNPETGQRYHLLAEYRIVALPDGTVKFPVAPFVRLTPIGG